LLAGFPTIETFRWKTGQCHGTLNESYGKLNESYKQKETGRITERREKEINKERISKSEG
tara:strand:+ start:178 stop:357 length:180 start_codon:yes stop_codon:yes gene_type:complete